MLSSRIKPHTGLLLMVVAFVGLEVILAFVYARIELLFPNTLHHNGNWISTKAGLEVGVYACGFKLLGMSKPELPLPVQVLGILVGLFGVGYLMVAARPLENRNILLLGFLRRGGKDKSIATNLNELK